MQDACAPVMCFLFKQKTAYEMRISDWSSDVCSSDLKEIDGIGGCYAVSVDVLVTPAEIDAELEAAEAEFDRQEAEKIERRAAEEQAKAEAAAALVTLRAYLLALDPAPAVVQVDGVAYFQWESGGWADEQEGSDASYAYSFYDDLAELLENAGSIGLIWPTIAAWEADPHGDNVPQVEEQVA